MPFMPTRQLLGLALSSLLLSSCDSSYRFPSLIEKPDTSLPDPSEPTGPDTPPGPANPIDPTDPPGPTDPIDPPGPTDPIDPPGPTDPTDPPGPTDPTDPPDPTDPIDPPGPTDPIDPPPPAPTFPEPTSARWDELDVGGFYDVDATGNTRAVRNDLSGNLPAMVQFAQSHTVDPKGNEARHMPRLTSERAALLLVTPDPSLGPIDSLRVAVSVNGQAKGSRTLLHPNQMYRSDNTAGNTRRDYNYSRRAFSVHLPWDWVVPGMSLSISDDNGRNGNLAAADIEFGAPGELVVQSIRMGMLTAPNGQGDGQWFLAQPEQAAADYFQTIPAAQLTVGYYEPLQLDRVMVGSGVIYDIHSSDPSLRQSAVDGGVYGGDMREDVGKSTVSVGTNLANFGLSSSAMKSQNQPQLFQHVLAHHNVGLYANGRQSHGLSGGNGMLTVYDTRGNEFSHEIGHHYGLGHYPGLSNGNYFWAGHHHDSGWGYIAYRKRMRANLHWNRGKNDGMAGMPVFEDLYSFGSDAMSGGHYASSLSHYTHYTGYSAQMAIQPALNRVVPDQDSSTGWSRWNATTRRMEQAAPATGSSSVIHMNLPGGHYLRPRLFGVPVFTLIGGYDPDSGKAVLYPPMRGNWGNVYDLPAPAASATARQCWVRVQFANGSSRQVELAGKRMSAGSVNKLHINLAQADKPTQASLSCREPGAQATLLDTVSFPQNLATMRAPVVVGREAGYSALRRVELPQLEAALNSKAGSKLIKLSSNEKLLHASWGDDSTGLSSSAREVLQRYNTQESNALRLNRWMSRYRSDLEASNNTAALAALKSLLTTLGLDQAPLLPPAQLMRLPAGHCLKVELVNGQPSPYVSGSSACTGDKNEQWLADARGSIRSAAHPTYCLSGTGGNSASVQMSPCNRDNTNQEFDLSALPAIKRAGRCLDLSGGYLSNNRQAIITYNCSGGSNQRWTGLQPNENLLLALLNNRNLTTLMQLDLD